jgi:hypothetical protein
MLIESLDRFAETLSSVNPAMKAVGRNLRTVFLGSANVLASRNGSALVRVSSRPGFWVADEAYRYVQVMPGENAEAVAAVLRTVRPFLQTVVAAVPDGEILPILQLFGKAGASNIHHPGLSSRSLV